MSIQIEEEYSWNCEIKKGINKEPNVKMCIWDVEKNEIVNEIISDGVTPTYYLENSHHIKDIDPTQTTQKTPHKIRILKYGFTPFEIVKSILNPGSDTFYMEDNTFITESSINNVSSYTGIEINHAEMEIRVSDNHSINELYNYLQRECIINPQYGFLEILSTLDGINFKCYYNLIIDSCNLSGSGKKINIEGNNTCSIENGGTTNIAIKDINGTITNITIKNIILNSEVRIFKTEDDTEFSGVEHTPTDNITFNYKHTEDMDVWITVMHRDYKHLHIKGIILTDNPQIIPINQVYDRWSHS